MPVQCRLRSWVALAGIAALLVAQGLAGAQNTVYDYKSKGFTLGAELYSWDATSFHYLSAGVYESVWGPGRPDPVTWANVYGYTSNYDTGRGFYLNGYGPVPRAGLRTSSEALTTSASVDVVVDGFAIDVGNWTGGHAAIYLHCEMDPPTDVATTRSDSSTTFTTPFDMYRSMSRGLGRSGTATGTITVIALADDGTVYTLADNDPITWGQMGQNLGGSMTLYHWKHTK